MEEEGVGEEEAAGHGFGIGKGKYLHNHHSFLPAHSSNLNLSSSQRIQASDKTRNDGGRKRP
jgi:hypothetical protein